MSRPTALPWCGCWRRKEAKQMPAPRSKVCKHSTSEGAWTPTSNNCAHCQACNKTEPGLQVSTGKVRHSYIAVGCDTLDPNHVIDSRGTIYLVNERYSKQSRSGHQWRAARV